MQQIHNIICDLYWKEEQRIYGKLFRTVIPIYIALYVIYRRRDVFMCDAIHIIINNSNYYAII